MPKEIPNSGGVFLPRKILASDAWWKLNGTTMRVYLIFHMKCRKMSKREGQERRVNMRKFFTESIKNNGQLVFKYKEAEKYGLLKQTFTDAIDNLIKYGFLDIAEEGINNQPNRYTISDRWEKYGTPGFEFKERKKRTERSVGKNERFPKNQKRHPKKAG